MATSTTPKFNTGARPQPASVGDNIRLEIAPTAAGDVGKYDYVWHPPAGSLSPATGKGAHVTWHTVGVRSPGPQTVNVAVFAKGTVDKGKPLTTVAVTVDLENRPFGPGDTVPVHLQNAAVDGTEAQPFNVSLQRAAIVDTPDLPLWNIIRRSAGYLSFNNFYNFINYVVCQPETAPVPRTVPPRLREKWTEQRAAFRNAGVDPVTQVPDRYPTTRLPFTDVESYRLLKAATEAFMMVNCGVDFDPDHLLRMRLDVEEREDRLGLARGDTLAALMRQYVVQTPDVDPSARDGFVDTIPYLALVRQNIADVPLAAVPGDYDRADLAHAELCYQVLREKLTHPCMIELLWSYWHEEGMLVQTMNAISMRFQNRRGPGDVDPLVNLTIDPLRPLGNLIWGYIQDEQHRLTLARRVYEYDHEYGLTLCGRAVPRVRGADTRSKFLEAFHTLLHRASIFYKEDDDATMIADPFPVLNALRDVHLLLAEGAHNQWGDLPWTARHEMLMQQWLLARPEFRDFLPTRVMVAYPEPWMDKVDAMKRFQGWTDTSVRYFHDLGVFGEQILLSIRFGDWSNVFDREQAGNWARYWRQEVQWYVHAYNTVTGVDLSSDMQDTRQAELRPERYMQPAFHLQRRLVQQRRATVRRSSDGRTLVSGRSAELDHREVMQLPGEQRMLRQTTD
jgi:hypothetical protein